ncbi:MAG: hypothetical protein WAM63_18210, partial [Rhodomicrobium sp.]
MLRALTADAIFIATLFIEILAALSLIQARQAAVLREEFTPVLSFYRTEVAPVLGYGANAVWPSPPQWFADASILAAILFFLFFIAQARKAMAPYDSLPAQAPIEAVIDWALPAALCAIGALISGPTLLPFLTLPAALLLGIGKLAARPC